MRNSSFFGVLLLGLLMAGFNACTEPRDFSSQLRALDSLQTSLNKTESELNGLVLYPRDTVTAKLQFIQDNFKGPMPLPMAHTLLRIGSFRDQLQQLEQWKENLNTRSDNLENEMSALRKTLSEMATHDANNAEITALYADSLVATIEVAQQFWHTKINEWLILEARLNKDWKPLNDTLVQWADSIQRAVHK